MKKILNYSLGRRGFFSEINNMIFCKIYAERHNCKFVVNSFFWNCRLKYGLRDYFEKSINEVNSVWSSQTIRTMKSSQPISIRSLFYLVLNILNNMYLIVNRKVILGTDVFDDVRDSIFLSSITYEEYSANVKKVLTPNDKTLEFISQNDLYATLSKDRFLGVHIRRGDKITTGEMKSIPLSDYSDLIKKTGYKKVYLATDDRRVLLELKEKCDGICIYSNPFLKQDGFSEGDFNKNHRQKRYHDTLILLFDIYMLVKSDHFIGTFSSNLSRIVPCYLGLEKCKSLDIDWYIG